MRYLNKITILIAFLLSACALAPKGGVTPQGQVLVYLQAGGPPTYEINFSLDQVWLEGKTGAKFPLGFQTQHISSLSLFTHQLLLAQGSVNIGSYTSLSLKFSEATVIKKGKKILLHLPPEGVVKIPINLFVAKDRTTTLFLNWQPASSLQEKNRFLPLINVHLGKTGLKNLLLYVSNAGANYLSVIDRGSNQVIDTITVGESPKGMVLSEDKNYLYVVNSFSNSLSVIETTTNRVIDTIPLNRGIEPTEIAILPHTSYLYVTATASNAVLVVDTLSRSVVEKIEVGQRPIGLAVDAEKRHIYVANSYSNDISIIDTTDNKVIKTIGVGGEPRFLRFYQKYLLVVNSQSETVSVIDRNSFFTVYNIFVPGYPGKIIPGLKGWLYVAGERSNCIYFVTPTMNIAPKKLFTPSPSGMALDRDRKLLYIANTADNNVAVLDLISERIIGSIEVGERPYDLILVGD
ncbi:MAG: beta-propeller fold lactonase family protein [Candidatus Desulfofervidaceae bacterium]|nr:beta-propeller fold lactonase family protein [Candidatus Desulfofervidaceae bacterium]